MTRYVFPELFYAAGAPIVVNGEQRLALRWLLHASLGLPRALFHVWQFKGRIEHERVPFDSVRLPGGERLITWSGGAAVAVQLFVSVPSGSAELRAYSAASAAGHIVDQRTVVGPISSVPVSLVGTPIASVVVSANASVGGVMIIRLGNFVNHPDWTLIETVGLPASSPEFDSSGYPLDPQGPVGAEIDPVEAAIRRVKEGTPDTGWPSVTDRGMAAPPFDIPDPDTLVRKEIAPLTFAMAELLTIVGEPSQQVETEIEMPTEAPRSVVGAAAAPIWQARARPARVRPLGTMLLAAGTDPFAALAFGFGTTLGFKQQPPPITHRAASTIPGIYMVTVEHKVRIEKELPFDLDIEFVLEGELAALFLGQAVNPPTIPAALTASAATQRLDPPQVLNGPWLEVAGLSWANPVVLTATAPRPSSYAITRSVPAGPLELRNETRLSGGSVPFVAATAGDSGAPVSIRYTESGLPEMLPGDPATWVYSIAAQDWFGRWSGWTSADYTRASVAPQIPGIRKVELLTDGSPDATQTVPVAIEFTWGWAYRTPADIHLRVLTHAEGTAPPGVNGSVLRVGGPVQPDLVLDFSAAGPDTPPPGVTLIAEETSGSLRTYRVEIPGVELTFGTHPRIAITARARASESIVPARLSAWSRDVQTGAASPVPPPPAFVPAAMWWASVPDPRGVARTTLAWDATAPFYAVFEADETALRRELDQPSADLEIPAAERLITLRSLPIGTARRAFRRIADRVPAKELEVALPRGSKLIHFYGVIPISETGVEGTLPTSSNAYFAVAAPTVKTPEPPMVIARDQGGTVSLLIEAPEPRVPVGRIEVFRAPSRHRAVSVEDMGPPIAVVDASSGVRAGGVIRFELTDPTPGAPWQSVFYRAVAWGQTDRPNGIYGGRSLPSPSVEVVPGSPLPPTLTDPLLEDVPTEPDFWLVSFQTDVTLARTLRGAHTFAVHSVLPDASIQTARETADRLPLIAATLPTPLDQPCTIFRFDPTNPRAGRTYAWVPRTVSAVILEVTDPAGRTTRHTETL